LKAGSRGQGAWKGKKTQVAMELFSIPHSEFRVRTFVDEGVMSFFIIHYSFFTAERVFPWKR